MSVADILKAFSKNELTAKEVTDMLLNDDFDDLKLGLTYRTNGGHFFFSKDLGQCSKDPNCNECRKRIQKTLKEVTDNTP